ncbi:MAG: hypothetical protein ACO3FE_17600, partial [Planctomycetaceae bacterium]
MGSVWKVVFRQTVSSARERAITDDDIDLFLAIVAESRRLLVDAHPTTEFQVILWSEDWLDAADAVPKDDDGSKMLKGLRKITANVQPVSEIFSDDNQREKSWLSERDKHHAAAHRTAPHHVEGELTIGLSAADRQRDSGASGVLSQVRFRLLNRIPRASSGSS